MFAKKLALVAALVAALLLPAGGARGVEIGQSYHWTIAMNVSNTTINYMLAERFAKLMKEKSGGKIDFDLYYSGQLGNTGELHQGVVAGSINFGCGMSSDLIDFVPQSGLFDLPNVFPDVKTMRKVLRGGFLGTMNQYYEKGGVHMLCFADAGFRQLSSNKPVRALADLSGQKIRVMPNPNHVAYWKALGANPVAMEFGEVFMALQQKTIDGQENPYMNIVGNNMQEVQKYIIETNHIGHVITFVMNYELYKSLPAEVRALIDECAAEAADYAYSLADESIAKYKQTCVNAGCEIITLSPETLAQFRDKASVVYGMVRKKIGDTLVDTLLQEVEKAK